MVDPFTAVKAQRATRGDRSAVVAIWNDVLADRRADFLEWHNREHMPERVGIAGFRRGRRFVAIDARPEFFTLYDTEGAHVLTGPAYLERLNNPTAWTSRAITAFVNTSRSLCTVACAVGLGEGGLMMTLRFEVEESDEARANDALEGSVLPSLVTRPGVVRASLCIADREASSVQSAEKRNIERARVPGWVILVEGAAEPSTLKSVCDEWLSDGALAGIGARGPIERGLYQLQYACFSEGAGATA